MPAFSRRHFERVLTCAEPAGRLGRLPEPADVLVPQDDRIVTLRGGVAEGPLAGGNLTLLQCLIGTPYFPDLDGAILFLEDVGEDLYRVDRMLAHLRLIGALDRLAGVVVGRFTELERQMSDGALGFDEVLAHLLRARSASRSPTASRSATSTTSGPCPSASGPGSTPTPASSSCWSRAVCLTPRVAFTHGHAHPHQSPLPGALGDILIDVRAGGRGSAAAGGRRAARLQGIQGLGHVPAASPSAWPGPGSPPSRLNLSGSGVDDAGEFAFRERFGHNTFSAELRGPAPGGRCPRRRRLGVAPPIALGLVGHSRGGGIGDPPGGARLRGSGRWSTWAAISSVERWSPAEQARVARSAGRRRSRTPAPDRCCRCTPTCWTTSSRTPSALDILGAADGVAVPWLIVHGTEDEAVSLLEGGR